MRASLPTTIVWLSGIAARRCVAYAAVKRTISTGFNPSPTRPPIVPRIPEILFTKLIICLYSICLTSNSEHKRAVLHSTARRAVYRFTLIFSTYPYGVTLELSASKPCLLGQMRTHSELGYFMSRTASCQPVQALVRSLPYLNSRG